MRNLLFEMTLIGHVEAMHEDAPLLVIFSTEGTQIDRIDLAGLAERVNFHRCGGDISGENRAEAFVKLITRFRIKELSKSKPFNRMPFRSKHCLQGGIAFPNRCIAG